MIRDYRGHRPKIGNNVFIAPTAVVIGKVTIGDNASIWYGTVVRGDRDSITIGENVNIQDNCTLHTDPGMPVVIGSGVSVGHAAVVHGCTIEKNSLIGIQAVVLNGAVIREGSVVGSASSTSATPTLLPAFSPPNWRRLIGIWMVIGWSMPLPVSSR